MLLQQVSALLLKEYREQFLGAPLAATWIYLRQWARDTMPQNPLVTHETSVAHLRDPTFLRHALRYVLLMYFPVPPRKKRDGKKIKPSSHRTGTGRPACSTQWRHGCASTVPAWVSFMHGTSASTTCLHWHMPTLSVSCWRHSNAPSRIAPILIAVHRSRR